MDPSNQEKGVISLAQLRANPKLHSEADEQTQIRIEKGIVKEQLQTYYADPRYRIVLDHDTPTIGYQEVDPVTNTLINYTLPATNVALHQVDIIDVEPAPGSSAVQGKIHSLYLYVHAGEPYTADRLAMFLKIIMQETDKDNRFFRRGTAWAVLSWGLKMMFFEYSGGSLVCIAPEDIQKKTARVNSPEIEPMD